MKIDRHEKIMEIIENFDVETQEEMQKLLEKQGITVTQATLSRDIREMNLIKVIGTNGGYKYIRPVKNIDEENKLRAIISGVVISVDYALNTVVVKCQTGMAQAVCVALDSMNLENIVGTLAGDDTIFILLKNEKKAIAFVDTLNDIIFE